MLLRTTALGGWFCQRRDLDALDHSQTTAQEVFRLVTEIRLNSESRADVTFVWHVLAYFEVVISLNLP